MSGIVHRIDFPDIAESVKYSPSPIQVISFTNSEIFIKRDDLVHPRINGNKARKFESLLHIGQNEIENLISWGGAQSNAMYALSWIAKYNNWKFHYYCKTLPEWVRNNPAGNLCTALENNMILHEIPHAEFSRVGDFINNNTPPGKNRIIPIGGQTPMAESGIQTLARELQSDILKLGLNNIDIFISSGTGTSALYLSKNLAEYTVYTMPVVGNRDYLLQQMISLYQIPENLVILTPDIHIPFAKPYPEFYEIYRELLAAGIEFDLIYDIPLLLWIKNHIKDFKNRNILFIHSGGVHGNASQLLRYHVT